MLKYTFYGHACFLLDDGEHRLLFDPYVTDNPAATVKAEDIDCDFMLISHWHWDHMGDAARIAKRTGALIISTPEVISACSAEAGRELNAHGMNLGGSHTFPFGKVRMVTAKHSSGVLGGIACGFVVYVGGQVVYFAGDTALFEDMKLIGRKDRLDYAMLPIGDNFTMGLEDAVMAAQWLNVSHVVPLHYNTWDLIKQDVEHFKELTEQSTRAQVHIVNPGETIELA